MVTKILQACHAALYGAFLPLATRHHFLLPLPEFDPQTGNVAQYTFHPQFPMFCRMLKDNRKIANVDRVHAYNSRFRFEAVWAASDDGRETLAVFGIDLYNWHHLGNEVLGRPQGCFGMYMIGGQPAPRDACIAPAVELGFSWTEPLNPFEE